MIVSWCRVKPGSTGCCCQTLGITEEKELTPVQTKENEPLGEGSKQNENSSFCLYFHLPSTSTLWTSSVLILPCWRRLVCSQPLWSSAAWGSHFEINISSQHVVFKILLNDWENIVTSYVLWVSRHGKRVVLSLIHQFEKCVFACGCTTCKRVITLWLFFFFILQHAFFLPVFEQLN